jgi:transcriptional regulator with XRE-family HTH domain
MHPLEKYRLENKLTQKELAEAIQVDKGNLSKIISGINGVSADVSYRIKEKLGIDVPATSAKKTKEQARIDKTIEGAINFWERNKEAPVAANFIQSTKDLGQIQYPLEGDAPFIDLGDGKYIMVVPLVNEYAYAGYLSSFSDPEYLEDLPKHTIIVDKHHRGQYRAFEIVGDSMDNDSNESIVDGSIATGREIQQHLWTSKFHTHRYKDYIIVSKTEGIIAKRIIKQDLEAGTITLHSLNPDKDQYPDFDMHLDDIQQMFNIVAVTEKR